MRPLIVDASASVRGQRSVTRDVIGAGPRAIAGLLENRGMRPRLALAETILDRSLDLRSYDLLLLSGMTSDLTAVRRVASRWKAHSEALVVVGGPISSDPADALIRARGDLAVIGEGEQTLEELLKLGLERGVKPQREYLEKVPGIAYLEDGALKVNRLRPVMRRADYDALTPSTKVIRDYPLYYAARVYVEALRGCSNYLRAKPTFPNDSCVNCDQCENGSLTDRYDCPVGLPPGCGYCSVPSLYGPPKSRSTGKIIREVRDLLSEGVRRVVLSAPDILDYGRDLLVEPEPLTDPRSPEPNYEALEGLLSDLTGLNQFSEGEASLMIENVKGSLVTERAAGILGRYLAGTPVNIGLETGSTEQSDLIGRPSTPEETLQAVRRLRKARMKPYVYFIHGLPGQSDSTVRDTVRAIGESVDAGAQRIILYRFQPLPMSAFGGHPRAPPAARDRQASIIHEAAARANRSLKAELLGRQLRVVVAEPYERDRRLQVAYPMLHGPVVLVEGAKELAGEVVDVTVDAVVSDRIVKGRLVGATL